MSYIQRRKANANKEISHPVDEHGNGHGSRSWTLREQLCRDHPGNGTRPQREENDKEERCNHGEVGHPLDHFLYETKKLLFRRWHQVLFPKQIGGEVRLSLIIYPID